MKGKEKPYWLKGGMIGIILSLIIWLPRFIPSMYELLNSGNMAIPSKIGILAIIYFLLLSFIGLLIYTLLGFIIGSLIGLLIGKSKR